jgi:acyl-CoA thioesterase FadM
LRGLRQEGYLIVAVELAVKYHAPAHAGETLEIATHVASVLGNLVADAHPSATVSASAQIALIDPRPRTARPSASCPSASAWSP